MAIGIALAVGSLAASAYNAKKGRDAQKDAVETPTRTTGINEAIRKALQSTNSNSFTNVLEDIIGSENMTNLSNMMESFTQNSTGKSSTNTDQQQTTSETGTTAQDTKQTVQRGTEASNAALDSVITSIQGGSGDRMQAAMDAVLRSGMPALSNAGNNAGAFNDTTSALLKNDLTVRAAEAGLQAEDNANAQLLQAIQAAQGGTETTTGQAQTTENRDVTAQLQELVNQLQQQKVDGSSQSQQQSEQQTNSSQTRNAQEQNNTQSETATEESTLELSDQFANPGDRSKPAGGTPLSRLINNGATQFPSLGLGDDVRGKNYGKQNTDVAANGSSGNVSPAVMPGRQVGNVAALQTALAGNVPMAPAGGNQLAALQAIVNDPSVNMDENGKMFITPVKPEEDVI